MATKPTLANSTPAQSQTATIYVFQSESGQYRVWPPVLVVAKDALVSICNFTPGNLSLKFPDASKIRLGNIGLGQRASFSPGVSGGYAYEVLIDGFRAVAHSDPSIIVD
jgi:hypothetical protein